LTGIFIKNGEDDDNNNINNVKLNSLLFADVQRIMATWEWLIEKRQIFYAK